MNKQSNILIHRGTFMDDKTYEERVIKYINAIQNENCHITGQINVGEKIILLYVGEYNEK